MEEEQCGLTSGGRRNSTQVESDLMVKALLQPTSLFVLQQLVPILF